MMSKYWSALFSGFCFCLSAFILWSPAEAIIGGDPLQYARGSIGRMQSNGNFLTTATYIEAWRNNQIVGIALSATPRLIRANETLRFIGGVTDRLDNTGGFIRNVVSIEYYVGFNSAFPNRNNMVGYILSSPIQNLRPCILANRYIPENTAVSVAGWGSPDGRLNVVTRNLREAMTTVANRDACVTQSRLQGFPGRVNMRYFGCVRNKVTGPCANDRGVPIYECSSCTDCLIYGIVASVGQCGTSANGVPVENRWSVFIPAVNIMRWLESLGYYLR